ncbi:MAG: hypothetical protein LBS98_03030, partial [Coriobacteriales bacterium]|nr:hypothetical protein [Coriobacteriales bacterium]
MFLTFIVFIVLGFISVCCSALCRSFGFRSLVCFLFPYMLVLALFAFILLIRPASALLLLVIFGSLSFFISLFFCLLLYAKAKEHPPLRMFCLGQITLLAGISLGALAGYLFKASLENPVFQIVAFFLAFALYCAMLLIVLLPFIQGRALKAVSPQGSAIDAPVGASLPVVSSRQLKFLAHLRARGLTEREVEIALGFASGHSAQHIADTLVL